MGAEKHEALFLTDGGGEDKLGASRASGLTQAQALL
jgi:hypothetical protein